MIKPTIAKIYKPTADNRNNAVVEIIEDALQPIVITQRLDRELDSGSFDFIRRDDKCKDNIEAPLSHYIVTLDDGVNPNPETIDFIGTDQRTLLRGKFGDGNTQDTAPLYRHSVALTELTKLLEGELIDGFAVTQPEDESQRVSLYRVLDSLLQVTTLRRRQQDLTYYTYIPSSPALVYTKSPQFKWGPQTTLWECLCDIGSAIDAIPRLVVDQYEGDGEGEVGYFRLCVDFDLINTQAAEVVELLDDRTIDYGEEVDDSQYNTQLRSVVENVKEE